MLRRALTVAAALVALPLLAGTVSAADVKVIAILTPEKGTDFGWNQQAVAGAKAVGEKYGIKVVTAEDGIEALFRIEGYRPSVVVLDLELGFASARIVAVERVVHEGATVGAARVVLVGAANGQPRKRVAVDTHRLAMCGLPRDRDPP